MTKDETSRLADTGLDRRSYLKAATGIAGLAALGTSASAATDYEEIVVDSGETYRKSLSDGETWENVVLDITAPGAGYSITATADDWTVRNVGVRGDWDHDPGSQQFIVRTDSADATGLVENVYLGDGTQGGGDPGGLFVHARHAGTVTIRNCNIQGFPDNGIYGSAPGTSHGNGGVVRIENTYVADCGSSGLRIGSDGSSVENCVAWDCDRGLWCLFSDELEAIDSNFGASGFDIRVGSGSQESGGPYGELSVTNTRWESEQLERSQNAIHGSSAGAPAHRGPDALGAPTSPEAAASGDGSGDEPAPEPEPEPEFPEDGHLVAFVTEPDASYASHEFYADGPVSFAEAPYDSPSGKSIEGGTYTNRDFVEETDDGWHAGGTTGGGAGDAYVVEGPVTSVTVDQPDVMWIELDGERVSEDELVSKTGGDQDDEETGVESDLVAFVTEPDAAYASHEFYADGPVSFAEAPYDSPSGGSIEGGTYTSRDFVEEVDGTWHAGGVTGGGAGDAYAVEGPVTSVSVDQPDVMWIELNGERVSEAELVERTGGDPGDDPESETHTLEVAGQFDYRVEVSGEIRPAESHARWLSEGEAYGDDWAEWWLSGSDSARTVWEFTGEITSLEIDDHDGTTELRTLAVDGEELDHGEYVDTGPHRLDVAGQFAYRVEVSGEIRPADAHAKWLNEGDAYGDDWAEWWLSGSESARTVWEFTGDITSLDVGDYDGVTDVRALTVDGEPVEEV
ncbi:right-handed parallel beta-helix repeat-containing protein [Halovivax cerinus]|uniref:Right-handed parallel beta-helix repeat-containing protein n=1 Tax=Halovivax cerinus TaxID=1487865 RepID=A0ABD5NT91_9EURY|nr:right-handed parallel beta-helix repeat-containing protein [Halovivax cerinus]